MSNIDMAEFATTDGDESHEDLLFRGIHLSKEAGKRYGRAAECLRNAMNTYPHSQRSQYWVDQAKHHEERGDYYSEAAGRILAEAQTLIGSVPL